MTLWNNAKGKFLIIAIVVLMCSTLVAVFAYRAATVKPTATTPKKTPTIGITPTPQPTILPTPTPTPTPLPLGPILGIESNLTTTYAGIPWVRFGYRTCGVNTLSGNALKTAIADEHSQGVRVLVTTCQTQGASLYDTKILQDVADSGANAVQCGNEEMKYDPGNTSYVPPANFASSTLCGSMISAITGMGRSL